jgi:hypothetical protein|tara:strand:+ start:991 stop:1110 length:120 start_codon:yes stop_codon:yes gene_type:complete
MGLHREVGQMLRNQAEDLGARPTEEQVGQRGTSYTANDG